MKNTFFRRRKKIVNSSYQLKCAFRSICFLYIYSILFGAAIFIPLATDFSSATNLEEQAQIASTVLALHENIWPALIFISVLVFIGSILVSHRTAGPVYRLTMAVDELLKGNLKERIRLRKGDDFIEIETSFNRLADFLETAQEHDSNFHSTIKEKLVILSDLIQKEGISADGKSYDVLNSLIQKIGSHPDAFSFSKNQ